MVFSGDGTYNEAINGAAGRVPFGFVPGGGASVFPRALGMPRDPVEAAARIGRALAAGRTSTIGARTGQRTALLLLGRDRARCRGCPAGGEARAATGTDAGRATRSSPPRSSAFLFGSRLRVPPQLELDGFGRAAMLFVANGRPYTYAGPLPVTITGEADFAAGLDFVAPREVSPRLAPASPSAASGEPSLIDPNVLAGA